MREPVRLPDGWVVHRCGGCHHRRADETPLSPRAASPRPQVRTNDVQLAAATTPLTPRKSADQPAAVHVLAEVSRGLESTKAANPASNPVLTSARARSGRS